MNQRTACACMVILALSFVVPLAQSAPPEIDTYLKEGKLSDGVAAMQSAIDDNPSDMNARFSLGVTQFLQAVERLGQDQYRFGLLGNRRRAIPFMRLPIPENDQPETLTYEKARSLLQQFLDGLMLAEATLAEVKPADVKLSLTIGQIRMDLNSDGVATDEESLWRALEAVRNPRQRGVSAPDVNQIVVVFDDADVLWLRGYCHVLSGLGELALAYDWRDQFERTAHLFYPDIESPYVYLQQEGSGPFSGFNGQNILDLIAFIHTVNYECVEPDRMKVSLAHLESVIALSRESWTLINLETDNDHEWLPNPKQTAALGEMRVSPQMQAGWQEFLDESKAILQGKKLLPFWRGIEGGAIFLDGRFPQNPDVGINVRKIFTEPARLDLVLWLQGTGLQPFLEQGEQTDPETWGRIMEAFEGNFFLFMAWFN